MKGRLCRDGDADVVAGAVQGGGEAIGLPRFGNHGVDVPDRLDPGHVREEEGDA